MVIRRFFEKLLVADDVLAEPLLERTTAPEWVAGLEQRVERLDAFAGHSGIGRE